MYYYNLLKRVRVLEQYLLEGKRDQEILNNFLGDEYYAKYNTVKNKIKDPEYKDIYQLIKKDPDEVKNYIDNFQSNSGKRREDKQTGAEKIYEDDNWVVYKITTYKAAQLYGKHTRWCITGRYPGHEGYGEEYFNNYIKDNDLDGGYYFYINKHDPNDKYCLLQTKSGKVHSIWDAPDTNRGTSKIIASFLPDVPGIKLNNRNAIKDLYNAVENGNYDDVKRLLDAGVNPNRITGIPWPVLLEAASSARKNSNKILELLLKSGADPNIKSKYGKMALMQCEDVDKVKILLKYGADPNMPGDMGLPPLVFFRRDLDIVKALIDGGADVNANYETSAAIDGISSVLDTIKIDAKYNEDAKKVLDYIMKNIK